jgi:hypothetical protein
VSLVISGRFESSHSARYLLQGAMLVFYLTGRQREDVPCSIECGHELILEAWRSDGQWSRRLGLQANRSEVVS